ncbi:MAG TPA: DNA replication/repair protein RecF [Candidatus Limnocylindrales bacterium]|nr:DNA replication/repair protein RecF [Candidatus Limnocylindrales bacterium]
MREVASPIVSGIAAGGSVVRQLRLEGFRGYASADLAFGDGPQLVWGPNASGKTSLLEAIVVLAWGRSHRTSTDTELVRWGGDVARIVGDVADEDRHEQVEVALARAGSGVRKRIRVNGVPRRAAMLASVLRVVVFAPEEMLLVVGPPSLRREALDRLAGQRSPAYLADLSTYGRALAQRNALLRAIREAEEPDRPSLREQLRLWDPPFLEAGFAVVAARLALLAELAAPVAAAHAEIAPEEAGEGALSLRYVSNASAAPGEDVRAALVRRLAETADKEVWNGTTLVGPHRDDIAFDLAGRDLASFASRGQQRTAILAFKLAEVDVLTAHDGRRPLLLLDDVFSELDPERRAHLVRRIADLPQAFVTTTTLEDLDPGLRRAGIPWRVTAMPAGASIDRAASG